jgi:hypothetical protein
MPIWFLIKPRFGVMFMWINIDREGSRFRTSFKMADWKTRSQETTIADEQLMTYALSGTTGHAL